MRIKKNTGEFSARAFFFIIFTFVIGFAASGIVEARPSVKVSYLSPKGIVKVSNPTIIGSVNRPQRVASAWLNLNGGPAIACYVSGSTISCPTSGLADKSYKAVISVRDTNGRKVAASGNFIIDTAPPVADSVLPAGLINTTSATISASYSDSGSGVNTSLVRTKLDGLALSGCTATTTLVECPVTSLAQGSHTISGTVSDNAGYTTAFNGSFQADSLAPVVKYTGSNGYTASPIVSASYSDTGSGINTAAATVKEGAVNFSCVVTASSVSCPAEGLAEGSHWITFSVPDNAGNIGTAIAVFIIDKTPPVVSYGGPTGSVDVNNPLVTGGVSDSSPVSALLTLGGPETKTFECGVSGGDVSCQTSALSNGTYSAVITGTDAAGNSASSATGSFTIDSIAQDVTPPQITYTGSAGNTSSPVISAGYVDDMSGVDQSSVTVTDGSLALDCTATASEVNCPADGLSEGMHSLTIAVADNSGNGAVTTASFTFDKTPPQVTNVQPAGAINTGSTTVSADYSDSVSGINTASASLTLDGSELAGCVAGAAQISCPASGLGQGSHTIGGSVSDNAGNIASISGDFQVEAAAEVPRTIVSLTFDDGRASQPNAGAILASHGVNGTFYVESIQLGSSGYYMSLAQVRDLAAAGNEIGGHTLNHLDLTKVSNSTVISEVCGDQQQLQAWGFPAVSFSYPYGTTNTSVESVVSSCKELGYNVTTNYKSGRIVGGLQCSGCDLAESMPPQDPYRVRTAGGSPTSSTTLDQLKSMVTKAESTGGWLQIPFHSVCNAPSSAPVPGNAGDCKDSYSITYSNLDQFVQWLKTRSSSGTAIMTVSDAMNLPVTPPPPPPPPPPPGPNLVQNPSLELDENGDNRPDGFSLTGYGTNTYTFTRVSSGAHSGTYAEQLTISALSSGDRKIVTIQDGGSYSMTASPGTMYQTSVWYKSDKPVLLVAYYHDSSGWHYWAESPYAPASSSWAQINWKTPAMPSNADYWSFGPALTTVGTMTVDDFSASTS